MQILNYDYLAFQVFWEGTKNFSKRSKAEQTFIKNLLTKYQILVLTEDGYKRSDKAKRVQDLASSIGIEYSSEIRQIVMTSFFKDIDFLLDQTIEKTEENITFLPEIAVMGMFDPEVEDKKRKRAIEIKKQVLLTYTHDEKGKVRTNEEREKFLIENEVKTKQEYLEKKVDSLEDLLRKQNEMFLDMMKFMDQKAGEIKGTDTQLDGERILNTLEIRTRRQQLDMQNLLDLTQGGKNWSQIALRDLPRFFTNELIAGLKRRAISCVTMPLWGPMAIIDFFVVTPLKMVVADVKYISNGIQHLIGWGIVGICIANIYFIYTEETYEEERRELYELYATIKETVPVKILYDTTKNTIDILWSHVPGSVFFARFLKLMSNQLQKFPGVVYEWMKSIIAYVIGVMKDLVTETLNTWWQEKMPSFKLW